VSGTIVVAEWFYRFLLYYAVASTFLFMFGLLGLPHTIKWIKKKLWARRGYIRVMFKTRAGPIDEKIMRPDNTGHINYRGMRFPFRKEKCAVDRDGMLVALFDEETTEQVDLRKLDADIKLDPKVHSSIVQYAYLLGEMRAGQILSQEIVILLIFAAVAAAGIAAGLAYYNYTLLEEMGKSISQLASQVAKMKANVGVIKVLLWLV